MRNKISRTSETLSEETRNSAIEFVSKNGHRLGSLSAIFQADVAVVLAAVRDDPLAIRFALNPAVQSSSVRRAAFAGDKSSLAFIINR